MRNKTPARRTAEISSDDAEVLRHITGISSDGGEVLSDDAEVLSDDLRVLSNIAGISSDDAEVLSDDKMFEAVG